METGAAGFTTSPPSPRRCSCPTSTSTLRTPPRLLTGHTWPMWLTRRCRNTTTASLRTSLWSVRTNMDRCGQLQPFRTLELFDTRTFDIVRLRKWMSVTILVTILWEMFMWNSKRKMWVSLSFPQQQKTFFFFFQDALKACNDLNNRWFGGENASLILNITIVVSFKFRETYLRWAHTCHRLPRGLL